MEISYYIYLFLSALSAIGCLFIIYVYHKYQRMQIFVFSLIRTLSVIDLLHAFSIMLPNQYYYACQIQAYIHSFTIYCQILWSLVMMIALYIGMSTNYELEYSKFQSISLLIVLFVSAVMTLAPLFSQTHSGNPYGKAEPFCWIVNKDKDLECWIWRGLIYFILTSSLVLIFVLIGLSMRLIKKELSFFLSDCSLKKRMKNRMIFYPTSIMLGFVPLYLMRIFEILQYKVPFSVVLISGMALSSVGLIDTIVYGMTGAVKIAIRQHKSFSEFSINLDQSDDSKNKDPSEDKKSSSKSFDYII